MMGRAWRLRLVASVCGLLAAPVVAQEVTSARHPAAPADRKAPAGVTITPDDIGGQVTGPKGPEAGVWVIAETTELPVNLAKVVVSDDQGRYVIPDLKKANY